MTSTTNLTPERRAELRALAYDPSVDMSERKAAADHLHAWEREQIDTLNRHFRRGREAARRSVAADYAISERHLRQALEDVYECVARIKNLLDDTVEREQQMSEQVDGMVAPGDGAEEVIVHGGTVEVRQDPPAGRRRPGR